MKNHRLFLAATLAFAGLVAPLQPARAAVVGYFNAELVSRYNFLANPLNCPSNNLITAVLPTAPAGSVVFLWDVTNQVFVTATTYDIDQGGWFPSENIHLPPGLGFVLYVPERWTNTFVGEVLQGTLTTFVAGTNKLSLLGSKVARTGALSGVLGFPAIPGAEAQTFTAASQIYSNACTYFPGYGWYDPGGGITAEGPSLNVAECFFVRNPGPDTDWTVTFSVSLAAPVVPDGKRGLAPDISSLGIRDGTVTLNILNPTGAKYDVQFSADRLSWTTVATGQSGTVWKGPAPTCPQGFFQLTNF